MFLGIGSSFYYNSSVNEYNDFQSKIDYDELNVSVFNEISDNQSESFVTRAIGKFADSYMFIAIEGGSEIIEYGYNHPNNYKLWMNIIVLIMFMSLIVPFLYLFTFIFIGVKELIILINKHKVNKNE
jgi:hypothetical protein